MSDMLLFLPELSGLLAALILFAMSMANMPYERIWRVAVLLSGIILASTVVTLTQSGEPFFPGIYTVDAFSQILKLGVALGLSLTLLTCRDVGTARASIRADVPFFVIIASVGMMMLVSATELLTLYVALELAAYGMYILVALHRSEREGSEAGIKYILYGTAASAATLYGISLVYGMTGSTYFVDIYAAGAIGNEPLFAVGALLALSGFFFKMSMFPFHAWAPDVYQAAPHQVTAYIGTVSKVAGIGALVRMLTLSSITPGDIAGVIFALAVASMTFGNLAALVQKDLKRLLAYSAIAHAGYMLVGLIGMSETGIASVVFYGVSYVVMGFGAFLVITWLGRDGHNPTFDDLRGLHKRNPFLAFVLLVSMFGLAGIPPTPGFAGKWFLFAAAVEKGYFILVLVAAINATISLYYYLQVVRAAYLLEGDSDEPFEMSPDFRFTAAVTLLASLAIGILPGPLWDLATSAARAVLPNL